MNLVPTDVRHPVFRAFGGSATALGLVRFRDVTRIGGAACQTLARFTNDEPALIDCCAGGGRAMVLASDLDNRGNDFPTHPSFVTFVHETVRYLASGRSRAREYLVGETPAGIPRHPGIAAVPDGSAMPRIKALTERDGPIRRVAINVDPREGDPTRMSADEFQSAVTRLKDVAQSRAHLEAHRQEDRQQLWRYILALMLVILAAEGMVAARA